MTNVFLGLILITIVAGAAAIYLIKDYKRTREKQVLDEHIMDNIYLDRHKELFEDKELNKLYDLIINNKVILDSLRIKPPYERSYYYKVFDLIWASQLTEEQKRQHIIFYLYFVFEN